MPLFGRQAFFLRRPSSLLNHERDKTTLDLVLPPKRQKLVQQRKLLTMAVLRRSGRSGGPPAAAASSGIVHPQKPNSHQSSRSGRLSCFVVLTIGLILGIFLGRQWETDFSAETLLQYFPITGGATLEGNSSDFSLLAPPSRIIPMLENRFEWLDTISKQSRMKRGQTPLERAQDAYLELIRTVVSGEAYGSAEKSVWVSLRKEKKTVLDFDPEKRAKGEDWTYLGYTMTGQARLLSLKDMLKQIFKSNVPGDFMETGVWRGGSSIYAKAVMEAYGEKQ